MMNTHSNAGAHQHAANTARPANSKPGPAAERCLSPEFGDDIFKILEQAMQEKERLASQQHTQNKAASSPAPQQKQRDPDEKMYRVFDCNAINAPGAMYKAVSCTPDTTSEEMIQNTLDRFGSVEEPSLFELRYAVEPDTSSASKKKVAEPPRVLHQHDCPVMVAEWFTDRPRRFELYRKSDEKGLEKRSKKWTEYWSSPSLKKKRFTFKRKKASKEAKQPDL